MVDGYELGTVVGRGRSSVLGCLGLVGSDWIGIPFGCLNRSFVAFFASLSPLV